MRQENDCFATRYIYRGIDSEYRVANQITAFAIVYNSMILLICVISPPSKSLLRVHDLIYANDQQQQCCFQVVKRSQDQKS